MKRIGIVIRYTEQQQFGILNKRFYLSKEFRDIGENLDINLIPIVSYKYLDDMVDICDGLILPGSFIDIDPKYYNEKPHPQTHLIDFDIFELDKACIEVFSKANKKIFGICAGLQAINVAYGGSLYQDIENHHEGTHLINIEKDSQLFDIYKTDQLAVNTIHHQAIKEVAQGFKVSAVSEDNVVEAIEKENILAVQWHPEILNDYQIFKKFFEL